MKQGVLSSANENVPAGRPGLDSIAHDGVLGGCETLAANAAGSAKTLFAAQYLAEGITEFDEPGIFVTFEAPAAHIRIYMKGLGWDIESWERAGKLAFVDASPQPSDHAVATVGQYDLGALQARVEYAINRVNAKRVSLDSLGAILSRFQDNGRVRGELFRIAATLKRRGVAAVMTAERTVEYGDVSRYGVEELVADNVVILRSVLEDNSGHRKLQGADADLDHGRPGPSGDRCHDTTGNGRAREAVGGCHPDQNLASRSV